MKLINLIKKFFIYLTIYLHVFTIQFYSFANAQAIKPSTLPTGNVVTSGQVNISQSSATMNVNQSSNNAIISWDTFNIGSQATVNFNQPSSSSNTLNRVRSNDPSRIYGNLNANGNLFFINPNGVLFGNGARVNVEGLVATTMNMANNDFNQQNYNFNSSSNSTPSIINYGTINSNYVALISTNVKNSGEINTKSDLALVSGSNAKLAISSNGKLSVNVSQSTLENLVDNSGTIKSENGQILIKSSAAKSLVASTINSPSQKKKLISQNGVIKLISNTGTVKAKNIKIDAGENGRVVSSGKIDVSSNNSKAGKIEITGKEISIQSGSNILAKGANGGGEILIGGDWQGKGNLLQATYTTVQKNTLIDASSTKTGDGGKIVIWSDIKDQDSVTKVNGILKAKSIDGAGGKIETSGAVINTDGIKVDASSQKGEGGLWLIDPYNYTINQTQANTILGTLNSGTSVTITTSSDVSGHGSSGSSGSGDITVNAGLTLTQGSDATLTLNAARHITLSSGVRYLDTGAGKLSLAFVAGGNITQNTGSDAAIHIAGSLSFTTTSYSGATTTSSTTYNYTSVGTHKLTLASGYRSGSFDIRGAGGGKNSNGGSGAQGGKVTGNFAGLSAGNEIKIYVGGVGGNGVDRNNKSSGGGAGGSNGGGAGGGGDAAGGGGGATDIRLGGTALSNRILVAGGGGGKGGDPRGANGGMGGNTGSSASTAQNGGDDSGGPYGGKGGSQVAGGAGGNGKGSNGSAGSLGTGGKGSNPTSSAYDGGGGGGGGYYGGGGGGASSSGRHHGDGAGGGGGSSFANGSYSSKTSFTRGGNSGNGKATLVIFTSVTDSGTGNILLKGKNYANEGSNISTDGDFSTWGIGPIKSLSVAGDITIDKDPSNYASGLLAVSVNSGSTTTIDNVIDGTGGIKKTGSGTLKLTANNQYEGETQVDKGKLDVYTSNSLGDGTLALADATTLFSSSRGQPITISNDITLAGIPIVDVSFATGTDLILSGAVSGSGKIKLIGDTNSRKLRLTNANNSFSGGIDINTASTRKNKPILEIGANYASGTGMITSYGTADYGNISFLGNYTINNMISSHKSTSKIGINTNANNATLAGTMVTTGLLTKTGSGMLTLSNNNSKYIGAINVSEGTLYSGASQSAKKVFGTGDITVASGAKVLTHSSGNVANSNKLYLNGGTLGINGNNRNTWAGDIVLGAGTTSSIETDKGGSLTLTGTISGAGNVIYNSNTTGNGEMFLDGTNTYTGNTTINSNGKNVAVYLNGKLGGSTHNYAGNINIGSGGTFLLNHTDTKTPNVTFSGIISGAGGITKKRDYTNAIFTGANTFTGALSINAGTLTIGGKGSLAANAGNIHLGVIGISANSNLHYTSTTTPQRLAGPMLLGLPLGGAGTAGAITGTANHTISSAGRTTTITYAVKKPSSGAGSSGSNSKQNIQKQVPKFQNMMSPPPRNNFTVKGNTFKPGGAAAGPGSFNAETPPTGQPAGRITPGTPANFANANTNIKIGTPGPKMIMPAMAKFSAIKFDSKGPGIKTNFKPMKGTSFANFKPVAFKVDPTISNFKIQPFKPIKFGSSGINYKIPEKNIEVPDNNMKMNFEIKMKGGAALPSWIKFDPNTLQISGKPPAGYQGTLELDLVGTTEDGSQQSQDIEFTITE